jgi:hypothetical protein
MKLHSMNVINTMHNVIAIRMCGGGGGEELISYYLLLLPPAEDQYAIIIADIDNKLSMSSNFRH